MCEQNNKALYMKTLEPDIWEELKRYYDGMFVKRAYWSPKKYILLNPDEGLNEEIYNMPLRPDDIFVVTFPRSGTTWTQELVWLVANDLNIEKAKSVPLVDRYTFLEESMLIDKVTKEKLRQDFSKDPDKDKILEKITTSGVQHLSKMASPRFVKTHLPLSLLPPNLLNESKVIYVARDPRDVVVSYYHFTKSKQLIGFNGDLKVFIDLFTRNLLPWTPYFEHVKEGWQSRHDANMLFLFYEDMRKDLHTCVRLVAEFLHKEYTETEVSQIVEHLSFDNFKNNKSIDIEEQKALGIFGPDTDFVRKGKSGGFDEIFDKETTEKLNQWMSENLQNTDLIFPSKQ